GPWSSAMPRLRTRLATVSARSCMTHGRSISMRTVSHLDPASYSLPHCRCDKMQGVVLPVVIEPAEDSAELGLQAGDAAVKPSPRFLPTKLLRDRNDQWSRHRISFVTC